MSRYPSTICWKDHLYSIVLPVFCQRSFESVFFRAVCSVLLIYVIFLPVPHSEVRWSQSCTSVLKHCVDCPLTYLPRASKQSVDYSQIFLMWYWFLWKSEFVGVCSEKLSFSVFNFLAPIRGTAVCPVTSSLMDLRRIVDFSVCPAFYLLEQSDNC